MRTHRSNGDGLDKLLAKNWRNSSTECFSSLAFLVLSRNFIRVFWMWWAVTSGVTVRFAGGWKNFATRGCFMSGPMRNSSNVETFSVDVSARSSSYRVVMGLILQKMLMSCATRPCFLQYSSNTLRSLILI